MCFYSCRLPGYHFYYVLNRECNFFTNLFPNRADFGGRGRSRSGGGGMTEWVSCGGDTLCRHSDTPVTRARNSSSAWSSTQPWKKNLQERREYETHLFQCIVLKIQPIQQQQQNVTFWPILNYMSIWAHCECKTVEQRDPVLHLQCHVCSSWPRGRKNESNWACERERERKRSSESESMRERERVLESCSTTINLECHSEL